MTDHVEPAGERDAAASVPSTVVVDEELVTVRRSPKYSVFLLFGAVLGAFVALVLTLAFHGTDSQSPNTAIVYAQWQVFGFLALIGAIVGVLVGGVAALIFDRALGRRTHRIVVDREHTTAI